MKLYQTHFNANQPSLQQVTIPNYSTASIGIQVEKNGETISLSTSDATLVNGTDVISADSIYADHLTFPITTGDENEDKEYTLSVYKPDTQIVDIDQTVVLSSTTTITTNKLCVYLDDYVGMELDCNSISAISSLQGVDEETGAVILQQNYLWIYNKSSSSTPKWIWFGKYTQPYGKTVQRFIKGTDITTNYQKIKIEDGDYMLFRAQTRPDQPTISKIYQAQTIEGLKTNFNLRVNSTKSSVWDIS